MNTVDQPRSSQVGKFCFWTLIILVLGGLVTLLFLNPQSGMPRRAPDQKGPSNQVKQELDPGYFTTNEWMQSFDQLTYSNTNPNEVQITYSSGANTDYKDNRPFQYHHLLAHEPLSLPEFEWQLQWISVGLPGPEHLTETPGHPIKIKPKVYNAQLKLLTGDSEPLDHEAEGAMYSQNYLPMIKLGFEKARGERLLFRDVQVVDARTFQSLNWGHRGWSGDFNSEMIVETEISMWHQGPFSVVMDFAAGPVEEFHMPAEQGAEVVLPIGKVQILAIVEGDARSFGRSQSNGKVVHTIRTSNRTSNESSNNDALSYIIGILPKAHAAPLKIDFLDETGEEIQTSGGRSSGKIKQIQIRDKDPKDIKTVRIRYYPKQHRAFIKFPEIPGLPKENKNVEDLFQVPIPVVELDSEMQFRNWLSKIAQIQMDNTTTPRAQAMFPLVLTHTTPEQVLTRYLEFCPPGFAWELDPESLKLKLIDNSMQARFGRFIDRLFSRFDK